MGDVAAHDGKIAVSVAGSSYTPLGGVSDYGLSYSGGTIDVTDFDSAGWKEFLAANREATLSVTLNYDEDDAGQDLLRTQNEDNSSLYWRIRPKGDNVGDQETIWSSSVLTGLDESGAVDGKVELSVDVQLSGAPTIQNQPS